MGHDQVCDIRYDTGDRPLLRGRRGGEWVVRKSALAVRDAEREDRDLSRFLVAFRRGYLELSQTQFIGRFSLLPTSRGLERDFADTNPVSSES